ncbi:protein adenylyltransferase SelO [Epilithonimonas hominis]|uniref:protein adenylyltransferase SelO n=1 Tax=Epilithonimonas hominis TaxID=420404 RepID=UPI000EDD7675|nr:YdiU family protein [Epilithonimonas hominis]HAP94650.1 YdiU family protein [Chryseobacterium sp.]
MNLKNITQNFTQKFPGDFSENTMQRQTPEVLFCFIKPAEFHNTKLIDFNENLSLETGLGALENDKDFLVAQNLPSNVRTYATAYAGHQFGNWAGQLGDGRAIYAGEIINENHQTEIQWKGAGATPYSRHADGRAVLRSSIREYLMSEAMFHLGIPTTRALSITKTGEDVVRDMQYSGNPQKEQGAVVVRTAESFLRFGHFELLSARNQTDLLKQLADYTIENFYPEVNSENNPNKYIDWFQAICDRTLKMIIDWYRVGFVHGVMNTDNMSILGLTIDYGPFSMMDGYDLEFTPNTTDLPGKRYAFGKQGQISHWNLATLANAIFPLINDADALEKILDNYGKKFWTDHDKMLANKFGLDEVLPEDERFFTDWQQLMQDLNLDYTLFFQSLEKPVLDIKIDDFSNSFYRKLSESELSRLSNFIEKYQKRKHRNKISETESLEIMSKTNPRFILRNYLLFEAIQEAENGNYDLFFKLKEALENPYENRFPQYNQKRPSKYDNQTGCSQLSCSS